MYSSHEEGRKTDYLEELMKLLGSYLPQLGNPTSVTVGATEGGAFMRFGYGGMPQDSYQRNAGPQLKGGYNPAPQLAGKYGQMGMTYRGLPMVSSMSGYRAGSYLDGKSGAYKGGKAGGNAGSKGGPTSGASASAGLSAGAGSSGGGK